jgi:rhomboid family protein
MTESVKTILIINVAVFLASIFARWFPWGIFELRPALIVNKLMIWQAVTYMFVHYDHWHLAINMLMLWFFGPAIESVWGPKKFMFYYILCGVGGALGAFIFSFNSSTIGASGAIFGLLVAYAVMFPETVVLVLFFFPMKIKYAVIFFAGINLLGAVSSSSSGISHVAHLGGALFGYIYLKNEWLKFWLKRFSLFSSKPTKPKKHKTQEKGKDQEDKEVDGILDKISKTGMSSLTRQERRILDERSKKDR